MLRPTRRNFDDFVHLLDKMLSENIDRDFFAGDILLERKVQHADGVVVLDRPGSIQLLEEWLDSRYRTGIGEKVGREIFAPMREIRKLRQKPAHALSGDEFDRSLPSQQDELLGRVCRTLTQLRLALSSHPKARNHYTPPAWLDGDRIVFY